MPRRSISPRSWRRRFFIEAAQDVVAAIDLGHLGAEPGRRCRRTRPRCSRRLGSRRVAAAARDEGLVGRDHVLDAGDRRSEIGRRAGRDQDVPGAHPGSGRLETHRMGVFQDGAALDDLDARALERRRIGQFEPGDLAILVGDQRCPVRSSAPLPSSHNRRASSKSSAKRDA